MGLLTEAIKELPSLPSHMGTGHVRYSTTGSNNPRNIQPLVIHYQGGQIAVAHNCNLTNALAIRKQKHKRNGLPMRRVKLKGPFLLLLPQMTP